MRGVLSENFWNEAIWRMSAVGFPGFAIFMQAAVFVAKASMDEQDAHENKVEIGKEVIHSAGKAIGKRED